MRVKKIEDIEIGVCMSSCDMTLKYIALIVHKLTTLCKTYHIKSTYHKNLITISPKNTP